MLIPLTPKSLRHGLVRNPKMAGIALLAILPFLGCGWPPQVKYAALQAELDANRAKWAAAGINSYEYHYERVCFCPPASGVVRVEQGRVVSVLLDESPGRVSTDTADFPTIEELFAGIQASIDANHASIEVEFDPALGYPTQVSIVTSYWITDSGFNQTSGALRGL